MTSGAKTIEHPDVTLNVCMLLEHPFELDSRVLKEARSLSAAGHNVTVIARSQAGLPRRESRAGFTIYRPARIFGRFNLRALYPLIALEYFFVTFVSALFQRADVYHTHSPVTLLQAVLAGILRNRPVIYDCHELSTELSRERTFKSRLVRFAEKISLFKIKRVIMSDGESRASVFRKTHNFTGPVDYIYNCAVYVDPELLNGDLHAQLDIPATHRIVIYIGVVDRERGLESAVEAIASCGEATHLVMMGPVNTSFYSKIDLIAARLAVQQRVHYMPAVPTDEVPIWASSADLAITLIQPFSLSYEYSAPTKMFEALMARIPQVASDFPEIRRVLIDNGIGPAGVLVDPTDAAATSAAICRTLDDLDLRSELSENADRLVSEVYNWEQQEKLLLKLYADL